MSLPLLKLCLILFLLPTAQESAFSMAFDEKGGILLQPGEPAGRFIDIPEKDSTESNDVMIDPAELQFRLFENGRETTPPEVLEHANNTSEMEQLLAGHYASGGFLSAGLDSVVRPASDPYIIKIYSDPGCRYSLDGFSVTMKDNDEELLSDFLSFYGSGDPYDAATLESELRRYVSHLESQGYPLARADITRLDVDQANCEVSIDVDLKTDDRFFAAGVRTTGLDQYRPSYIETASGIRSHDLITPGLLQRGRRNLLNTGFFHYVSDGDILFRDNEAYVHYDVEERRANNIDLMFGYAPARVEGYNIVGRGSLRIRNAGWSGSTMHLHFERLEHMVTRLESSYGRQWISGIPVGAEGGFRFLQQDTSYQTREWHLSSFYNWTPERRLSVHIRQENVSANTNPDLPLRVLDGVTRSAGAGFEFDNTDSPFNPTGGMIFHLYIESGIRRITDSRVEELESRGTMTQQRLRSTLQFYYSLFPRQVSVLRIFGSAVESPEYNETDLMRFGGARSIRGYNEDQFRVSRTAWGDLEYRYLLDPYSHAFIFAAGGVYERPAMVGQETGETTGRLYSGGFGFRYRTPIGLMQFTYAVSAEDPLHNGKVHFQLSADF